MSDPVSLTSGEGDRPAENSSARTPYAMHKGKFNNSEHDATERPTDMDETLATQCKSKRARMISSSHLSQSHDDMGSTGEYRSMDSENLQDSRDEISSQLNTQQMEPKVKSIILKYVGSEQIVRCLEFAGFISPHVLGHLDENGVRRLEDFVGHACSFLSSLTDRQLLLGPVFSRHPDQFRLPTGAVLGLIMAANEIRQLIFKSSPVPADAFEQDTNPYSYREARSTKDAASQTLASSWVYNTGSREFEIPRLSSPSFLKEQALNSGSLSTNSDHMNALTATPISSFPSGLPSSISSSNTTDPMAVVNAAIQAAAVVAMAGNTSVSHGDYSSFLPRLDRALFTGSYAAISPSSQSKTNDTGSMVTNSHGTDDVVVASRGDQLPPQPTTVTTAPATTASMTTPCPLGTSFQRSGLHQSVGNVFLSTGESNGATGSQLSSASPSDVTITPASYTSEEISRACLERLKQHSSDRASRLAARQFVDAQLIRGRDFDMEMEISLNAEGLKRVTGIFYCHLCRVTRERTCAVRFSIARNRYPVLSNVLSHLKTHFQYKTHPTFTEVTSAAQQVHHLSTSSSETSGLLGADMAVSTAASLAMASPTGVQASVNSPTAFCQQPPPPPPQQQQQQQQQLSPTSSRPIIKCELGDGYPQQSLSDQTPHGLPGLGSHSGLGNAAIVSCSLHPMSSVSQRHLAHGTCHRLHHNVTDGSSNESRGLLERSPADQHVQTMPTA